MSTERGAPDRLSGVLPPGDAARSATVRPWRVAFVVAPWGWGTAEFVAEVAAAAPGTVVVDADASGTDLAATVRDLPDGVRLVVRARRRPAAAVRAARVRGGVLSIGPESLALRPWQAARAFDPPLGALLPGADVTRLVALADGWPGVLRLAHETLVGAPAAVRRRVADALPEEVHDVLRSEVVAVLPDGVRAFLAETACLPVLSAAACDARLGTADAAERLREAADHGVLLPVGDDGAVRLPRPLRACLAGGGGAAYDVAPPRAPRWADREEAGSPPWLRRVARAVRETPAYAAPPDPADADDTFAAGVEALLAGRATLALDLLRRSAWAPGAGARPIAAELAGGVAAYLGGAPPPPVSCADLALAARRRDLTWLADLADACAALAGAPVTGVAAHAWRSGDGWVAALADLVAGLASAGTSTGTAAVDRAAAFFASYGAGVLEAWCAALASVADESRAPAAAALARRTGCRGALAVALRAIDPAEAARVASEAGLDVGVVRARGEAAVSVRCFGRLAAYVGGTPVDLASLRPRARALLGLLALNARRPVHREVIAAALWPDVAADDVARRIHVAVSSVRRAFGSGVRAVVRRGEAYLLAADVDVARFDELATVVRAGGDGDGARRALAELAATYGGELLAEAGPAEWVVHERFWRRSLAADACERLAALALAGGDAPGAVAAARDGLRVDPYRDGLWQALYAALRASGQEIALGRARADRAALLADRD